jgi:ribonuclease HI
LGVVITNADIGKGVKKAPKKQKFRVTIFTDGSCMGYDSPHAGNGAWAAVLWCGPYKNEIAGTAYDTSNNRMELQAIISALKILTEPCEITWFTDSIYAILCYDHIHKPRIENGCFCNAQKKPMKNQDLLEELFEAAKGHIITPLHVRAHTGDINNTRVDAIAYYTLNLFNQGILELPKKPNGELVIPEEFMTGRTTKSPEGVTTKKPQKSLKRFAYVYCKPH